LVPRGGIEPPTRGFSVPLSPSRRVSFPSGDVRQAPRKAREARYAEARSCTVPFTWFHLVQSDVLPVGRAAAVAPPRLGRLSRQLREMQAGVDVLLRGLGILVPSLSHDREECGRSAVRTELEPTPLQPRSARKLRSQLARLGLRVRGKPRGPGARQRRRKQRPLSLHHPRHRRFSCLSGRSRIAGKEKLPRRRAPARAHAG